MDLPKFSRIINISEAARLLGISTKTLRRWEREGKIIPSRTAGGQRRYTLNQIENFRNSTSKKIRYRVKIKRIKRIIKGRLGLSRGLLLSPKQRFLFAGGFSLILLFAASIFFISGFSSHPKPALLAKKNIPRQDSAVLGASIMNPGFVFSVNVPADFGSDALFDKNVNIKGELTAANIINSIKQGTGIKVENGQNPTVSNTGVLSLQGSTGALSLTAGSGITISGLTITNSGITALTAGTGISVSGSTITNSDTGSSQDIFKNIAVSGQTTIAAGSNSDTLTFASGTGIAITTDSTNKKLTIASSLAGNWQRDATNGYVYLVNSTDKVGIGTSLPSTALDVSGASTLAGSVALGGTSADNITFTGRLANGTSILPGTDLGSDLGSSSHRFNNVWAANINSNSSQSFAGQTTFSYAPTSTAITQASVLINPTAPVTNGQLLGLGVAGYQRALIDAEGDIILGYNGLTSAPVTDYPLTIYGHNAANVSYIDTSGNAYFAGNLGIGTTNPSSFSLQTAGSIGPNATNTYNLGSSSLQWANVYGQTFYANATAGQTVASASCITSIGGIVTGSGACPGSSTSLYWNQQSGALFPNNSTVDLLVGGQATSSAKFAVLNVNSGTPVASVAGNMVLGSSGGTTRTIGAEAMNNLQLGDANTGGIALAPAGSTALFVANGGNVGVGTNNPVGQLNVQSSSYRTGQTVLSDGVTGAPPSYPNSFKPSLTVQTSEVTGSRPLFFGYNNSGSWASYLTAGACGTFDQMCLDMGDTAVAFYTALQNQGNTLNIGGGSSTDGTFAAVDIIPNTTISGTLGVTGATTLSSTLGVTGASTFTGLATFNGGATIASGQNLTVSGSVASNLIPSVTDTYNLGSSSLEWNNIYAKSLIVNGATIASYWQRGNGALSPTNITDDFLLGGISTPSAKFAFLNVAGGTPTASVSGNLSLAVPTTAGANTLNLLNNSSLNIQRSPGGDAGLTSTLYLGNDGNVGIGTTAPTSNLTLYQSGSGAAAGFRFTGNSIGGGNGGTGFLYSLGYNISNNKQMWYGDPDYIGNSNSSFIRIVSFNGYSYIDAVDGANSGIKPLVLMGGGGNVGIGTTNPLGKLDIAGGADANGSNDQYDIALQYRSGGYRDRISSRHNGSSTSGNDIDFYLWHYGVDAATAIGTLPVMTLQGNGGVAIGSSTGYAANDNAPANGLIVAGNVGIGTTAPLTALDVAGSASESGNLTFRGTTTTINQLNGGALNFQTSPGGDTGLTSRLYIANNGSVGIGTTTPGYPLVVTGDMDAYAKGPLYIQGTPYGSYGTAFNLDASAQSNGRVFTFMAGAGSAFLPGGFAIYDSTGGAYRFSISSAGNVLIGNLTSQGQVSGSLLGVRGNLSVGSSYYSSAAPTDGMIVQGSVGIGTTSPVGILNVNGAVTGKALSIFNETGDQALLTASSSGTPEFTVYHHGLADASVGGLATKVNAGVVSDSTFSDTAPNGTMALDSTDGRIYFRYAGAWHYVAQTAGFQIPSQEAFSFTFGNSAPGSIGSFDKSKPLKPGDFLIPFVEKAMSDGALHGLYANFADVRGQLLSPEDSAITSLKQQVATLSGLLDQSQATPSGSLSNTANVLNLNVLDKMVAQGAVTFQSEVDFNGNTIFNSLARFFSNVIFHGAVSFEKPPTFNSDTGGYATIKAGAGSVDVSFSTPYDKAPIVTASPISQVKLDWWRITNITSSGFTIEVFPLQAQDVSFTWIALAVNNPTTTVGSSAGSGPVLTPSSSVPPGSGMSLPTAVPTPTPASPSGKTATLSAVPTPTSAPSPSPSPSPLPSNAPISSSSAMPKP
ncbi:MerR family DNA-binding transcriptional regulator [Patescibacteria group bacterium]|nr:MerR family DNA-binding transcriptional regulator [Patescibacteria group bacterium]MCL5010268.1 MerR family DNA-binding transcriptional regulator [Patescibacteria group bacterium]